jgi:selenium metabolism protein YedF
MIAARKEPTLRTVIMLGHDGMGQGDAELGRRVLKTFLQKCSALNGLTAILLFNSGVRLAAEGSNVLAELHMLNENGIDVLPCGTCVDHYVLRNQIRTGTVSNMPELIEEMNRADKVIAL